MNHPKAEQKPVINTVFFLEIKLNQLIYLLPIKAFSKAPTASLIVTFKLMEGH